MSVLARRPGEVVQVSDHVELRAQSVDRTRVREVTRTKGELEAAICKEIARIERSCMGRGPKDIRVHLIGDVLIARLRGALTAAERHLVTTPPAEKGRELLKQMRACLLESARPMLETMVKEITNAAVVSLHHDISSITGEEFLVFTLADPPRFRETRRNQSVAYGAGRWGSGPSGRAPG